MKLKLTDDEFATAVKRVGDLLDDNSSELPNRETFAWWSLERDLYAACLVEGEDDVVVVSCQEDLDTYLEEADLYLNESLPKDWPHDILARFLE